MARARAELKGACEPSSASSWCPRLELELSDSASASVEGSASHLAMRGVPLGRFMRLLRCFQEPQRDSSLERDDASEQELGMALLFRVDVILLEPRVAQ